MLNVWHPISVHVGDNSLFAMWKSSLTCYELRCEFWGHLIRSLLSMRPTCNEFQRLLFSICTNLYVFCSTFVWHWYIVTELFYCYFFLCTLSHGWSSDRIILSHICLLCIGLCAFNRPSKGPTNEWMNSQVITVRLHSYIFYSTKLAWVRTFL